MQSLSIRLWYVSLWYVTWSHRTRTIRLLGSFVTPTPDHAHHQQQTQQTFHVQLLRFAYPDATNIEADAPRVASNRTRTGGRRGECGGICCHFDSDRVPDCGHVNQIMARVGDSPLRRMANRNLRQVMHLPLVWQWSNLRRSCARKFHKDREAA
jgi:hypothetical protein